MAEQLVMPEGLGEQVQLSGRLEEVGIITARRPLWRPGEMQLLSLGALGLRGGQRMGEQAFISSLFVKW